MQPCDTHPDPDSCIFMRHARFCSIFTDPGRLRIMFLLGEGERSVSEIAAELGLTMPNVSQHLRLMRDRGCLRVRREGRSAYYRVSSGKFLEAARLVREGLDEVARLNEEETGKENPDNHPQISTDEKPEIVLI